MASTSRNDRASGRCMCCKVCNMWCWRCTKWFPVLLIMAVVSWSYYAYVIELCFKTIESTVEKTVCLVVYHIVLVMFLWAYWRTILSEGPPVPDKFKLPEAELENLLSAETEEAQRSVLEKFVKNLPVLTRTMSGAVRYCNRCVLIKPDRAHHCSICARCVLKMDHHCPWVNNCVCFGNYKFFILFLGYALIYCLFITLTCLPYFIKFWKIMKDTNRWAATCEILDTEHFDPPPICKEIAGEFGTGIEPGRYHILFAFFMGLMFAVSVGSLFGYHCYLVLNNRTTLESFRPAVFRGGPDKHGFSIGVFNNFKEVFGNRPNLWLLPVYTSLGDGCDFPVRPEHQLQTFTTSREPHYRSTGSTRSRSDIEAIHDERPKRHPAYY